MRKEFALLNTKASVNNSLYFLIFLSSILLGAVSVLWQPFWVGIMVLLGSAVLFWLHRWYALLGLLGCLLGYGYVAHAVHQAHTNRLTTAVTLTQQEVTIERCWRTNWGHRCMLRATNGDGWYVNGPAGEIPQPGIVAAVDVELVPWSTTNNPGISPFGLWLLRHGTVAQGRYQIQHTLPSSWLAEPLLASRRHILGIAMEPHYEGVYRALVLGDRVNLSGAWKERVERTQTQHLLALSGLHVGTVALAAGLLFALFWSVFGLFKQGVLAGIRQDWYWLGALLAANALWLIALSSVSLWRALLMLLLPCIAWQMRVRWRLPHGLLLLATVMVCSDPLIVLDLGAWFSWVATLWLILLAPWLRRLRWWTAMIILQLALSVLLMPLYALWELPFFPGSVPLNILLIPWVTIVVLPSALLTAMHLPGAMWVFQHSVDLWYWLLGVFDVGLVGFLVLSPGQALAVLLLIGMALVMRLPWRLWVVGTAIVWVLHALHVRPTPLSAGEFDVAILDVGNASSMVIDTAGGRVMFDLGYGSPANVSLSSTPLRWHWRFPHRPWKAIVVSHQDIDHAGGLASVAYALQPERVFLGEWIVTPDHWPTAEFCDADVSFVLADVTFRFLRPYKGFRPALHNDASCVLEVRSQKGAIMLMGDASKRIEYGILQSLETLPVQPFDVLISGHHGSSTSTSDAWLAHLSPRWVVHSAGRHNRYDFPRPDVQNRVLERGAMNLCTCDDGTLEFRFRQDGIAYKRYGHRLLPWIRI